MPFRLALGAVDLVLSGRLHCALDGVDPEPLPGDHPLWTSPNALITPHIGGNASAFEPRIVKLLPTQLKALTSGEYPANLVEEESAKCQPGEYVKYFWPRLDGCIWPHQTRAAAPTIKRIENLP
jgi:hypothetical protein